MTPQEDRPMTQGHRSPAGIVDDPLDTLRALEAHEAEHARGQCECPCLWMVTDERDARKPLEARIAALEAALENALSLIPDRPDDAIGRAVRRQARAALAQPAPAEEVGRG